MADAPSAADSAQAGPFPNGLPFGANLEPVLRDACNGRLHDIHWFRTDWQRGGALTGYAKFDSGGDDAGDAENARAAANADVAGSDGASRDVVVKLPVPPVERRWHVELQVGDDIAPKLFAHGEELGGYDMAWVVMERLPHGPLSSSGWGGAAFDLMVDAIGRFSVVASRIEVTGQARTKNYESIIKQARDHVQQRDVVHQQRWKKTLKAAQRKLRDWLKCWDERPCEHWCHGDFHFGNAMTRTAPPGGPAILLDFAQVHRGHWIEDAVYFEHFYWSQRGLLEGRKLCSLIAKQRKAHGLAVDADWPQLASVQRALLAMSTPAMLQHEGNPQHVQAALELLESEV